MIGRGAVGERKRQGEREKRDGNRKTAPVPAPLWGEEDRGAWATRAAGSAPTGGRRRAMRVSEGSGMGGGGTGEGLAVGRHNPRLAATDRVSGMLAPLHASPPHFCPFPRFSTASHENAPGAVEYWR